MNQKKLNFMLGDEVLESDWLLLRKALWPSCSDIDHVKEIRRLKAASNRYIQFLAFNDKLPIGLAEASIRNDYVNGTQQSPVAFLEGIYVQPEYRRQGLANNLIEKVTKWALENNCIELASDALIDNISSHDFHKHAGFQETEKVVCFVKSIVK